MTPRQQEAHTLKNQGLTQQAIADIMGIGQSRVSNLLDLNRQLYVRMKKYTKTARGAELGREQTKRWARNNREKNREKSRKYYQANREKWIEYKKARNMRQLERKAQIVRNALAATFDKVVGEGLRLQLARRFQFKNQPVTDEQNRKLGPP